MIESSEKVPGNRLFSQKDAQAHNDFQGIYFRWDFQNFTEMRIVPVYKRISHRGNQKVDNAAPEVLRGPKTQNIGIP